MINLLLETEQTTSNSDAAGWAFIIIFVILFAFVTLHIAIEEHFDTKIWNNGKCSCGGNWQKVGERYIRHTIYTYKCDQCSRAWNSSFPYRQGRIYKSPFVEEGPLFKTLKDFLGIKTEDEENSIIQFPDKKDKE